mmetsp:Transcript_20464/g.38911  ORF Transcript_20464/g.38911 Transcript_20464/m.38911 type:complete len:242 (+) Transcript_20464:170-895(+)|eukprot:CAMPEP_0114252734 /NCGR_PEP_ID=MMETSP0058-20121206/16001_1 /TAXON_ID=36894 /ORGANISM="Pyramimonas parkeae, CCMP726" /LENGTH=241 /DNA_ID=CAMNT_0001366701 /DNA_START=163 /DNA_END=888 /DNA_ORIENTATION=-
MAAAVLDTVRTGILGPQTAAAVHELGYIAKQNNTKLQALEDCIPYLLDMMKSDELACKEAAMRTLQVLAEQRKEWRAMILEGGAVEILVETLRMDAMYAGLCISAAAKALWKLGTDSQVQDSATVAGAMPELVRLLSETRPTQPGGREIQRWVASALHGLTTFSASARQSAVDAGAVAAAAELHNSGSTAEIKQLAMDLMHALKPYLNPDQSTSVACKSRYQSMGAAGAVLDHRGKRMYSL